MNASRDKSTSRRSGFGLLNLVVILGFTSVLMSVSVYQLNAIIGLSRRVDSSTHIVRQLPSWSARFRDDVQSHSQVTADAAGKQLVLSADDTGGERIRYTVAPRTVKRELVVNNKVVQVDELRFSREYSAEVSANGAVAGLLLKRGAANDSMTHKPYMAWEAWAGAYGDLGLSVIRKVEP